MGKTRTTMLAALVLCVAVNTALARYGWHWTVPNLVAGTDHPDSFYYLSPNNGSHSVAMTQYGDYKVWTSILAERYVDDNNWRPCGTIRAYEFKDIGSSWNYWQQSDSWPSDPGDPADDYYKAYNCNTALNSLKKVATWGNFRGNPQEGRVSANDLTDQGEKEGHFPIL